MTGRFYMAIFQAVLLYKEYSWAINKSDMAKLDRFHKRAARHMTGCHIRKDAFENWTYLDHTDLLRRCNLLPIRAYIAHRRGALRVYLECEKGDLLLSVGGVTPLVQGVLKVLWWKQEQGKTEYVDS